jgi:hypothetical protein
VAGARLGKNSCVSSAIDGVTFAETELLRVLVLAELVRAFLRAWISWGFVPRCSIWPPFLISGKVGILDPISPVACHMPKGGLLSRKALLREPVRVRERTEENVCEGALERREVMEGRRLCSCGVSSPALRLASSFSEAYEGKGSALPEPAMALSGNEDG